MEKKESVVVGVYACPVCGKKCPVKRSARGRLSVVCKWQDDGCGSQLQTLTTDASMMLAKKIKTETKEPKQGSDSGCSKHPDSSPGHKKEDPPKPAPSPAESWGLM